MKITLIEPKKAKTKKKELQRLKMLAQASDEPLIALLQDRMDQSVNKLIKRRIKWNYAINLQQQPWQP